MFESEMKIKDSRRLMGRRSFLCAGGIALAALALWRYEIPGAAHAEPAGAGPAGASPAPKQVTIIEFTDAGERKDAITVPTIQKTDAEWRQQLSPDSFEVTRHADTERAFTGALLNEHDKGVFRCICCDTALFSSTTKFDSGTGWPSFWAPIAKENVVETVDGSFGMERTAVSCRRCDAHLGHVFDDGPRPTGLRYCMNSVALRFAKA
jgi:peptide-methionine (R)-S-oxide reductase